jgi:uncharacterized protein YcnI
MMEIHMRNRIVFTLLLAASPAAAHVTLTEASAKPGAIMIAHFRVGHGCSGSPTIGLRIAIPDGVTDVRPQPLPGWTVQTEGGNTHVKNVTWSGGLLAATQPGDFALAMTLPATAGLLYFPATQTCQTGAEQWSELPAADGHPLKHPAPVLTVSPISGPATPEMKMPPGMKM